MPSVIVTSRGGRGSGGAMTAAAELRPAPGRCRVGCSLRSPSCSRFIQNGTLALGRLAGVKRLARLCLRREFSLETAAAAFPDARARGAGTRTCGHRAATLLKKGAIVVTTDRRGCRIEGVKGTSLAGLLRTHRLTGTGPPARAPCDVSGKGPRLPVGIGPRFPGWQWPSRSAWSCRRAGASGRRAAGRMAEGCLPGGCCGWSCRVQRVAPLPALLQAQDGRIGVAAGAVVAGLQQASRRKAANTAGTGARRPGCYWSSGCGRFRCHWLCHRRSGNRGCARSRRGWCDAGLGRCDSRHSRPHSRGPSQPRPSLLFSALASLPLALRPQRLPEGSCAPSPRRPQGSSSSASSFP